MPLDHTTAADAVASAVAEQHPDARGRRLAAWLVAGNADELRAALREAFRDPRAETRRRAVLISAEVLPGAAELHDALLAALADPVWGVREAATITLACFSDDTTHTRLVAATLRDSSPLVRRAAATGIGERIDPFRDYAGAIGHRFERQRIRAADALGFAARAIDAVALLAPAVADPHPKVRAAALHALARLDPTAVRPLLPLVVRKCAEAEPRVATTARALRARLESET